MGRAAELLTKAAAGVAARIPPDLKAPLTTSGVLHGALALAFAVRLVFYPSEPLQMDRALRVDMVALPTKTRALVDAPADAPAAEKPPKPLKPEPPKPEPKLALPKPIAAPPVPNKISLDKAKKSQEDALKRLASLAKIERMAKQQAAAAPAKQVVRGNKVAVGASLTGVEKIDYDAYLAGLDSHVKRHWSLPEWLAESNLRAQVVVWIDSRGIVIKKQMVRSSGNAVYDQRTLEAIENASPFPAPPGRLANIFAVDGVKLGFPE